MGFLGSLFGKKKSPLPVEEPPKPLGPPAEGMRRVSVLRFESARAPMVYWSEVVLDGRRLRTVIANTNLDTQHTHVGDRSGRIFDSVEAAEEAFDAAGRVRGGWQRTERSVRDVPNSKWKGTPAPAIDPAQEAQLDAASGEAFDAAARVYADWLVSQNDPRGELAALVQAGASPDEFLGVNGEAIFGELDVALGSDIAKLEWQGGLLRKATLKRASLDSTWALAALTAEFLKLPVARFVTALRFGLAGLEGDNDWGPTLAAVASSSRASAIRELAFDFFAAEESEISWASQGDMSGHWDKFPALDRLVVRAGAGGRLGDLELPSLREFVRESGSLQAIELDEIVTAKWPNLERLEIWTGDPNYGGDSSAGQLASFFSLTHPKKLKHFGLVNCPYVAEAWPMLMGSPLLAQLESLDLSKGVLGDDNLGLLRSAAPMLSKLKSVDLSENVFSDDGIKQLRAALPNAKVDDQRQADRYRYVAVGE